MWSQNRKLRKAKRKDTMTRQELEAKAVEWGEVMSKADNGSLFVGLQGDTLIDTAKLLLEAKENLPKLAELIAKAEADEKQARIDVVAGQVAQAITKLCEGLGVAETLGEPLIGLRWLCAGATEPASVRFNPKTILREKGEPKKRGKKGEASERKMLVSGAGEKLAPNAFRIKFYPDGSQELDSLKARVGTGALYPWKYPKAMKAMLDEHPDWHPEG